MSNKSIYTYTEEEFINLTYEERENLILRMTKLARKNTFRYQGGNLTENEIKEFENDKLFRFHLKLREFDDKAKLTDEKLLKKIKDLNAPEYYFNLYKLNQ